MTNEELCGLLSGIAERSEGLLLPQAVVDTAREETHPLHSRFEWDDAVAGEKHRLDQARQLIRLAKVSVNRSATNRQIIENVPFFVRDPRNQHREPGYLSITRVQTDAELSRDVLINEFRRVLDALGRAKKVARVLGVEADVEVEMERVSALLGRVNVTDDAHGSA